MPLPLDWCQSGGYDHRHYARAPERRLDGLHPGRPAGRRHCRPHPGRAEAVCRPRPVEPPHTVRSSKPTASRAMTRTTRRVSSRSRRFSRTTSPAIRTSGRKSSGSSARGRCRRSANARPDDATYDAVIASLETSLDRAAAAHPNPGRTATHPAAHANRIPERHSRSPRARRRRRVAAARRRVQLRLRQRDGRRPVADAAGPLRLGGGEDQPAGGRPAEPLAGRRHHQDRRRPHAGGTLEGLPDRHARRRAGSLHVSAGRRVRHPDSPDARPRRAGRGAERSRTSSSCCSTASACSRSR